MNLSPQLRAEYGRLWSTLVPDSDDDADGATAIIRHAAILITVNRDRYGALEKSTGVPWAWIGCVHYREGSCNFGTHLANGDSLRARTYHQPVGLPHVGNPPFTWEQGGLAALIHDGMDQIKDWSIESMLYQFELYNGFGYRKHHPDTLSPYLWSYSNHEIGPGRYSGDGVWSSDSWDENAGAAVILQALIKSGAYTLKG